MTALAGAGAWRAAWLAGAAAGGPPLAEGVYPVDHVTPAAQLVLAGGRVVQLQGIQLPDQPERVVARIARFVAQAGGRVRLTFTDERVDNAGVYRAFVWRRGVCLNVQLVREGLVQPRLAHRHSGVMQRTLRTAYQEVDQARTLP